MFRGSLKEVKSIHIGAEFTGLNKRSDEDFFCYPIADVKWLDKLTG